MFLHGGQLWHAFDGLIIEKTKSGWCVLNRWHILFSKPSPMHVHLLSQVHGWS